LTASDVVLRQIVSDFEALAKLAERAINSETEDQTKTEALRGLRETALRGAALARNALASKE